MPIWWIGEASDGTPFIAMPFLQGEPLDARLNREPVAGVWLILKVAREVAGGLAAAHAKGLIHRDIKPGNIWLEVDLASNDPAQQIRRCKILDFGLARSVDTDDAQITASGVILGTPAYMAPEQARGEKVDARADLFSLGVTLYRMATGQLPFRGDTPMSVAIAVVTDVPQPVRELAPGLAPALIDLIDRLMCKNRDGRPSSAAEVAAEARALTEIQNAKQEEPTIPVSPVPDPVSTSRPQLLTAGLPEPAPRKRSPLPLVLAAGLLACVPLGLWLAGVFAEQKPAQETTKNDDPTKQEPKPLEQPIADPDRKAAEWVLNAGGSVHLNEMGNEVKSVKALPKEPFRLVEIYLTEPVKDADLAVVAACKNLTGAYLVGPGITNAGLAHFKECKELTSLNLSGTKVDG